MGPLLRWQREDSVIASPPVSVIIRENKEPVDPDDERPNEESAEQAAVPSPSTEALRRIELAAQRRKRGKQSRNRVERPRNKLSQVPTHFARSHLENQIQCWLLWWATSKPWLVQ